MLNNIIKTFQKCHLDANIKISIQQLSFSKVMTSFWLKFQTDDLTREDNTHCTVVLADSYLKEGSAMRQLRFDQI